MRNIKAFERTGPILHRVCGQRHSGAEYGAWRLFAPGDHIITTVCEHNSVLRALYRLRDQEGVQLSFAGVDEKGRLQYDGWQGLIQPNTKAVVVTGASNVTGNGTDLARVSEFAHRNGLLLIVDAAQTAGAQPVDVQALDIDVLCFTGHKALLGPQGTGGLYVPAGTFCPSAGSGWKRCAQLR